MRIPVSGAELEGDLVVPEGARGLVVFAHGSGSSRHSPRNRQVARFLQVGGQFGTLLFDLLTPREDLAYSRRFDIPLLAERLGAATLWLRDQEQARDLKVGYFGASTGAAAALVAAAGDADIAAVVSRGGRPDMAARALGAVRAPTLLIVGGSDDQVIGLNKAAMRLMPGLVEIEIVTGATHLFEEPGTLERVSVLALEWFQRYLPT